MSIEQCVRVILTEAVEAGLVDWAGAVDPRHLSAGDLVGPANVLTAFLASEVRRERGRIAEGVRAMARGAAGDPEGDGRMEDIFDRIADEIEDGRF